jgi:hypothetical protein
VIRLWYTRAHTLNGLDGAAATSIADDSIELLVAGASGFAAQERVQESATRYVPRKLREWADERIGEFERGLRRLAKRHAARHSGLTKLPTLDRWEATADGW